MASFLAEFFVPLKPFDEWPNGLTKEKLVKELSERLESRVRRRRFQLLAVHPGQYRGGRLRREGRELDQDLRPRSRRAGAVCRRSVKDEIGKVPGVRDPGAFNLLGQPNLVIKIDRDNGRALRLLGRRHQRRGAGGDRRTGGDARL